MKNLVKKEEGITLVALVVTIIVLLILAGIAISLTIGNNGLFSRAQGAVEKNRGASAKETVQLEVFGSYGTDGNIDLGILNANLKNVNGLTHGGKTLDANPIESLPTDVELDGFKVKIEGNGEVILDGISNSTPEEDPNPTLASKALPGDYVEYKVPSKTFSIGEEDTGYTAQEFTANDYTGTWQVLYNDETNGLQIVSTDDVTNGTRLFLGGSDLAKCKIGYNNALQALNKFSANYANSNAIFARSLGSLPTNEIPEVGNYNDSYSYVSGTAGTDIKAGDTYCIQDFEALKAATNRNPDGIAFTTSIWCWLASRSIDESAASYGGINFDVNCLDVTDKTYTGGTIFAVAKAGNVILNPQGKAVRVVVRLKDGIKTNDGDGTSEKPFKLVDVK